MYLLELCDKKTILEKREMMTISIIISRKVPRLGLFFFLAMKYNKKTIIGLSAIR